MLNFQPQLDSVRQQVTRRWFFQDCGVGLASAALASLLANDRADAATAATNPLAARGSSSRKRGRGLVSPAFECITPLTSKAATNSSEPAAMKMPTKLRPRLSAGLVGLIKR